jgi:hypothetical protein
VPAAGEAAAAPRGREVRVDVEEDGPRDVARPPRVAAAAGGIQIPADVGYDETRLAEAGGEPLRADERVHLDYFIFVTGWATFL